MSDDDLLTAEEVGTLLGVRGKWVLAKAGEGKMPYVQLPGGRYKRFRWGAIREWIREQERGA